MRVSNIKIIDDEITSIDCSGDKKSGMHPKIFLKINDEQESIECYYCGKIFMRKSKFNKR